MTLITVKVKPGSKESSISEGADGVITVRVKSRPIKGAANQELIKLLAYYFNPTIYYFHKKWSFGTN